MRRLTFNGPQTKKCVELFDGHRATCSRKQTDGTLVALTQKIQLCAHAACNKVFDAVHQSSFSCFGNATHLEPEAVDTQCKQARWGGQNTCNHNHYVLACGKCWRYYVRRKSKIQAASSFHAVPSSEGKGACQSTGDINFWIGSKYWRRPGHWVSFPKT